MCNCFAGMIHFCLKHKWGTPVLGLLCVGIVFPPWGYFIFQYSGDLQFNSWLVQYYNFFFDGLSIPAVINVHNHVSLNVVPIFYARVLHWIVTLLTFLVPVRVAFWFVLGFFAWIQYITCAYAFILATRSRVNGNLLSAIVLFSSYAMTNMYGRGALAEYVAASLLTSFLCTLLILVYKPVFKKELLVLASVFFALLGNTHAITTFSGTICFFVLALYALFIYATQERGRWDVPVFLLSCFVVLGSMGHYLYLVWLTDSTLLINGLYGILFLDGIDNLFLRFLPIPVSYLLFSAKPLKDVPFSPLVCQINIGLFIILGTSLFYVVRHMLAKRVCKRTVVVPVLLGVLMLSLALFLTWISVKSIDSALINAWLLKIQFPYRLITQINLLLMVGLFFLCPALLHFELSIPYGRQIFLLLSLGTCIYMAQLYIMPPNQIIAPTVQSVDKSLPAWHPAFYGVLDYATKSAFPAQDNPGAARFVPFIMPAKATEALATEPVHVAPGEVLRLSVLPFIWNHVYATNQATGKRERLAGNQLRASVDPQPNYPGYYVNDLPEGYYVFEAHFTPPRIWLILRYIHLLSMLVAACSLVYMGWRWLQKSAYGDAD